MYLTSYIVEKEKENDQIEMDVIDSTSDKAYKKILDISEDLRDVCKLATKMIPSDTEFVNYIGQLH